MKPQFIIIAGPNGAGKSINGRDYIPSGVPIFDGDLVFKELQIKYPHIEADRLGGGVAVALENARNKAIEEHANFAFESNFSNDMATDITLMFKEAGYQTSLVYFGLDSIKRSSLRVQTRVQLGGHYVPYKNLRYNFEEGIKRVKENLSLFDKINFVDTTSNLAMLIAYHDKYTGGYRVLRNDVEWFNKNFHQPLFDLANNSQTRQPGFGIDEDKPDIGPQR
jgi:predicted ABC-type ATPase